MDADVVAMYRDLKKLSSGERKTIRILVEGLKKPILEDFTDVIFVGEADDTPIWHGKLGV